MYPIPLKERTVRTTFLRRLARLIAAASLAAATMTGCAGNDHDPSTTGTRASSPITGEQITCHDGGKFVLLHLQREFYVGTTDAREIQYEEVPGGKFALVETVRIPDPTPSPSSSPSDEPVRYQTSVELRYTLTTATISHAYLVMAKSPAWEVSGYIYSSAGTVRFDTARYAADSEDYIDYMTLCLRSDTSPTTSAP